MKNPYLIKVRRRKGMLDLTEVGRQEQILEAVAHKDAYVKQKFPEASILEPYLEPPQPLPTYHREKVDYWGIIRSKLTIRPYLP